MQKSSGALSSSNERLKDNTMNEHVTFNLVIAIHPDIAAPDNELGTSAISNSEDQTLLPDHLKALINNVMNEANSANASQSLLELLDIAKNATDHTTKEVNNKVPSRRFMQWFKTVISNYTTPKPDYTTSNLFYTTRSPVYTQIPQANPISDEVLLQSYLFQVLKNLTNILEKLNRNIEEQISLNPLTVQPLRQKSGSSRRGKREATRAPGSDAVKVANATNSAVSTSPPSEALTLTPPPNPSSTSQDGLDIDPSLCTLNVTRRSYQNTDSQHSNSAVKAKLLSYLNDTFQEIETKIQPVQEIKRKYASDEFFRIGYIVANIDTLEVSVLNLREDMEKYAPQWEDKKVLDLFDKIMITNKVVTNLIDSLNELQDQKKGSQVHYNLH